MQRRGAYPQSPSLCSCGKGSAPHTHLAQGEDALPSRHPLCSYTEVKREGMAHSIQPSKPREVSAGDEVQDEVICLSSPFPEPGSGQGDSNTLLAGGSAASPGTALCQQGQH